MAAKSLEQIEQEILDWQRANFGPEPDLIVCAGGLVEEVGEMFRCIVKDRQGIRGTHEEWMTELRKELGDTFIKLVDVARAYGLSVGEVTAERWETIRRRNWVANPEGHGLPNDNG